MWPIKMKTKLETAIESCIQMEARYARYPIGYDFLKSQIGAQADSVLARFGLSNVLTYIVQKNYENTLFGSHVLHRS
jgi:hypothetical protein